MCVVCGRQHIHACQISETVDAAHLELEHVPLVLDGVHDDRAGGNLALQVGDAWFVVWDYGVDGSVWLVWLFRLMGATAVPKHSSDRKYKSTKRRGYLER